MPRPLRTIPASPMRLPALASLSLTLASVLHTPASHASDCPPSPTPAASETADASAVKPSTTTDPNADIQLEMDSFEATRGGTWDLKGDVSISQGNRELRTKDATYDPQSQTFATPNDVQYSDPTMKVQGASAQFDPQGSAVFEGAEF